jgi:hypothetical protein
MKYKLTIWYESDNGFEVEYEVMKRTDVALFVEGIISEGLGTDIELEEVDEI